MKRKLRTAAVLSAGMMLAGSVQSVPAAGAAASKPDYASALQMSLYFYECQQAGHLPDWNRVEWRGDATVDDDVDGGWYDAGDHVKFNLPMSYSAAMLAWGLYEYPNGVKQAGEWQNYVNNLTWALDYFVACDLGDSVVYQVGNGQQDHTWWGPVELLEYGMKDQNAKLPRTSLTGRNCSAVTAEMGAALAAGYCALKGSISETKRADYLKHAKNFFEMADADRSDATYADSDPVLGGFYISHHFYDELFWCANWLYMATGDSDYLTLAKSYIPNLGTELGQGDTLKYSWTQCWDDVQQGGTLLYAINTGDATWKAQTKKHLDYWLNCDASKILDGGLRYVDTWGCLRYACNIGFVTAVAADRLFKDDPSYADYVEMYESQINYCLGVNPTNQSFVVGYGENCPHYPHHRTSHGSWKNSDATPIESRHVLYGALVGGPNTDGSYHDRRNDFTNNEVATDYNAGYTALLCKMVDTYGGKGDPDFPHPEERDAEFFVEAKATNSSSGTTVSMKLTNHTAWPARIVDNISMRYYLDLSEVIAAGYSADDVVIRVDRDQSEMYASENVKTAAISGLKQYSGSIYYLEVTFPDGRAAMPISEGRHQCEMIIALVFPDYKDGWDATNDYSAKGLSSEANGLTDKITVYEEGTLIFGTEPDGTTGTGSISAAPPPDGTPIVTTPTEPDETTTKPAETKINWGDADCNGKVNIADVVLLAQYCAEISGTVITADGLINADCSDEPGLGTAEITKILEYIAGLITEEQLAP